jgi:uncharacterized protein YggE
MSQVAAQPLTTIRTLGVFETNYTTVNFTVTVLGRGKTSIEAKKAAEKIILNLNTAIASIKNKNIATLEENQNTTAQVNEEKRYNQKTHEEEVLGFLATFTQNLKTSEVDKASVIFDTLSNVEGCQVAPPSFKVKDITEAQNEALKDAKNKLDAQKQKEFELLNLDAKDYFISAYATNYDTSESDGPRPMRARAMAQESVTLSPSAPSAPPAIQLEAGKAVIKVTLNVTFSRRRD